MSTTAAVEGVQAQHQRALNAGQLLIQQCGACQRHVYYPRELCPHCGAMALRWVSPSGAASVHSLIQVARAAHAGGDHAVVLVDLAEGVRLMSRVVGVPYSELKIGQRLRLRVQVANGQGVVVADLTSLTQEAAA